MTIKIHQQAFSVMIFGWPESWGFQESQKDSTNLHLLRRPETSGLGEEKKDSLSWISFRRSESFRAADDHQDTSTSLFRDDLWLA